MKRTRGVPASAYHLDRPRRPAIGDGGRANRLRPLVHPGLLRLLGAVPGQHRRRPAVVGSADYLYVSHLHRDHFDPDWLSRHMSKDATVLLPDFPVPDLRDALEDLGFKRFVQTRNNQIIELDGLRILINALVSPTDGPIGDSG